MSTTHQTMLLGDLIAAAFDEAACQSTDPRIVSRLAAHTVWCQLQRQRRSLAISSPASQVEPTWPWH